VFGIRNILASALLGCSLCIAAKGQAQDVREMLRAESAPAGAIWLERLDVSNMSQDWGSARRRRSIDEQPLTLRGQVYVHGVGTHAQSELTILLGGAATRFVSMAGLDDERKGMGSIRFEVWVDNKKRTSTPVLHGGDEPALLDVNLTGAKTMTLVVDDAGDGITNDHADWAGAMLFLAPGAQASSIKTQTSSVASEPAPNIHHPTPPTPAIHGPRVTGTTPGRPFLFLIPSTGRAPLRYSAKNLPAGLKIDPATGIISGTVRGVGEYSVDLSVRNALGTAKRRLRIVAGDHKLSQTPALGWNSWNVWAGAVDGSKVRAAADAMLKSGLASRGFQYVNIDDTWEAGRDSQGDIQSNAKFPDMKGLCDYVHSKGLKIGIYSSPGPKTCANYEASYKHEAQDAMTWALWGFDYIKHDWCSYGGVATGEGRERFVKPYRWMREALDKAPRDIYYSLCQYGMGNVWEWGASADVMANSWRTTGDITDTWSSLQSIAFSQDGHEKYAGPGHWNDPDMLVVGKVGWGPSLHSTRLAPNEQILHISMWCLQSAPLLIGCDMTAMDPFTLDLLTNDEVLDIDQDPLGKPAGRKAKEGNTEVWARPLYDGTVAVGLFNRGRDRASVTAKWTDIGVHGRQPVRDLWQWKNLGAFDKQFTAAVPAHGCVLVKIGKPKRVD
jgi:alpha-galactosidase